MGRLLAAYFGDVLLQAVTKGLPSNITSNTTTDGAPTLVDIWKLQDMDATTLPSNCALLFPVQPSGSGVSCFDARDRHKLVAPQNEWTQVIEWTQVQAN
jgi:hypothetical protein